MIAKTDFQYDSARTLVEYIKEDKEQPVPVKDHTGKELDQAELKTFVEASKHYGVERHMIIAPDPDAEFDPSEVDRKTRQVMDEWRSDRLGARYVYAVHGHDDQPHAHVAVTGREQALHMDKQDVVEFRETAREAFAERDRLEQRTKRTADRAAEADRTRPSSRERSPSERASSATDEASPTREASPDDQGVLKQLIGQNPAEPVTEPTDPAQTTDQEAGGDGSDDAARKSGGPGALESTVFAATRAAGDELTTTGQDDGQREDNDQREDESDEREATEDDTDPEAEQEATSESDPGPERDYW